MEKVNSLKVSIETDFSFSKTDPVVGERKQSNGVITSVPSLLPGSVLRSLMSHNQAAVLPEPSGRTSYLEAMTNGVRKACL